MMKKFRSESGFTLIEVMVVLVLIGLATAMVLPRGLKEATTKAVLDTEAQKLAGAIRLARQKAITRGADFKIEIESVKYYVYAVGASMPADPSGELDKRAQVSGAPFNIVFDWQGKVSAEKTVNIEDVSDPANKKIIEVNTLGMVNIK